ncbi:sulfite exporter TauE/SafE family protein [Gordonia polyisoprenivorans]|uniref:sulfite exporter TauE/SafE family protein n=1 Tax=Gordonia polyisoprenivorans TaxID=84595 RepID=UPI001AD6396A|nr:sulfite exporter TauE/SafE family protein [Gordonia polyisoprenivorans]QTI70634.1 sulfite exporter TauE/SafE family protein [Gordonia polyisoprenivorans]
MSILDYLLLVVAGFGAGLIGYVTGLASVVSYPALLAVGLPPIAANVTNTVALVSVGIGSLGQSGRILLDGDRRRLVGGGVAALIGGSIGAVVLLLAPADSFKVTVPYLVAIASIALLLQPRLRDLASHHVDRPWIWYVGLAVVSIYGGYFGAGAGIMLLALALIFTSESLWRATLLKSLFLGIANLVAALLFAVSGPVHWTAALAMAIGCLAGGWCGPPTVKRLPAAPLRIAVGIAGLGLAVWLGVNG